MLFRGKIVIDQSGCVPAGRAWGGAARAHGCPGQQRRCPSRSAVGAITFEQWRVVFGLNGDGMFHTAKAFVPGMGERGWGQIVNTTPNSVSLVAPRYRHCVAGKMAVIGLPPGTGHRAGRPPPILAGRPTVAAGGLRSNAPSFGSSSTATGVRATAAPSRTTPGSTPEPPPLTLRRLINLGLTLTRATWHIAPADA
ncbi:SDR family NAD(P)-dependent oxidoreductase [Streptomyces europaeiscabiei]|uniref:SDR family NAD(P)-dependent oxidoreductase n=1 Tax=Streptomyces europaeiscabiei TaxID=146819 RepID=UPI0038D40189